MKNGHLETWQVVRWLSKHPTHTAEAPETATRPAEKCTTCEGELNFEYKLFDGWACVMYIPHRSDWTIRNERGRKVRFKKRAKLIRVGEFNPEEWEEL